MLNVCALSARHDYLDIENNLSLFIDRCKVYPEIRPFMLNYRSWDVYVIDTRGMQAEHEKKIIRSLGRLISSNPARLVLIWSQHTWSKFVQSGTVFADYENCVYCDTPGWCNQVVKALERVKRPNGR